MSERPLFVVQKTIPKQDSDTVIWGHKLISLLQTIIFGTVNVCFKEAGKETPAEDKAPAN